MITVKQHLRSLVTSDGAVILDPRHNVVLSINPIGAYVWDKLQIGEPLDSIISALAQETNTELPTVERDVLEFIADLTAKHLVERRTQN